MLGSALGALEPMHPVLTKSSLFLAVLLVGSPADASVTQCQSEKGAGYPWSWREIDGKRCWYKGTPGMDKKQLHWTTKGLRRPQRGGAHVQSRLSRPLSASDCCTVTGRRCREPICLVRCSRPCAARDGDDFAALADRSNVDHLRAPAGLSRHGVSHLVGAADPLYGAGINAELLRVLRPPGRSVQKIFSPL